VLQTTGWAKSIRLDSSTPFKVNQIENQEVVEPGLAVATTENKHVVANDTRGVELAHRGFTLDHGWDIKG